MRFMKPCTGLHVFGSPFLLRRLWTAKGPGNTFREALATRSVVAQAIKKEAGSSVKAPRKRRSKAKPETLSDQVVQEPAASRTIDLLRGAPSGAHWQQVERWVLFSDLHVSYRTLAVCCQVLERVKAEAVARNAGIIFLGMRNLVCCCLATVKCWPSGLR